MKILVTSGMIAPARVPQVMIVASFHHRRGGTPPVDADVADQQIGHDIGAEDGGEGRNPHQGGEGRLEVHGPHRGIAAAGECPR